MKKLKLTSLNLKDSELLKRDQLKMIVGGSGTPGGDNGNPCPDNCTRYCHRMDNEYYGIAGTCPPSVGGTSCHNYCCEGSDPGNYYWC